MADIDLDHRPDSVHDEGLDLIEATIRLWLTHHTRTSRSRYPERMTEAIDHAFEAMGLEIVRRPPPD